MIRARQLETFDIVIRKPSHRPCTKANVFATIFVFLLTLSLPLTAPVSDTAAAQARLTPAMALEQLLTADEIEPQWFTEDMLAAVSVAELRSVIVQLTGSLGELQRIDALEPPRLEVFYERGVLPADIFLDDKGRISGIFFEFPRPVVSGFDDALAPFAQLPGATSVFVMANGFPVAAHNSDRPLAVGSTFKLAVLAALLLDIDQGVVAWDDVIMLDDAWRSLPSGVLQQWPAGSPLTIHSLAANMISISDNTATDALIHIVGRDKAGMFTPRNDPFLTTREAFMLKNPTNADTLAEYRAGDAAARHAVLDRSQQLPLIEAAQFAQPTATDIEWFFTTEEACGLMAFVQHVPLMSINPGVAKPTEWARVAYKGGSEPGVLNMTTWLVSESGTSYCVSATWNDENNLDELRFMSLYNGVLEAIKQAEAPQ